MRKINNIQDIVDWGLCVGCGACFSICTKKNAVKLVNISAIGIRPQFNSDICKECVNCLNVCPGHTIDGKSNLSYKSDEQIHDLLIGSYFSTWVGHALDQEIRFNSSSGGILSALATFCVEKENMSFVLHTGMDPENPWQNKTVISRDKTEILSNAGSRYCTSSPCEMLKQIEESDKPCVFIGKPCDVAAVNMARKIRPKLDEKLGLVLSFFCAGTPCSDATIDLVQQLGIDKKNIKSVRYRGQGWPGHFQVESSLTERKTKMTYSESWGIIQAKRPFRCHLCPDGMGQLADISSGDAWNKHTESAENPGLSHVLARTSQGKSILAKAVAAGYLHLSPCTPEKVITAQQGGLIDRRKAVYGRQIGMKLLGIPTTNFKNFNLFDAWLENDLLTMLKSIIGTQKRMLSRGLWHKNHLF